MSALSEKAVLDALPQPVLCISSNRHISYANLPRKSFLGRAVGFCKGSK